MDSTETISSGQNKKVRHRLARGVSAADNKQILAHAERRLACSCSVINSAAEKSVLVRQVQPTIAPCWC